MQSGNASSAVSAVTLPPQNDRQWNRTFRVTPMWPMVSWLVLSEEALGALLNLIFLIVALCGIRACRLSVILYLFLANRAIADVLMSTSFIVATFAGLLGFYGVVLNKLTAFVANVNFLLGLLTYITLSTLKFISVSRPFLYRQTFTASLCVKLAILNWLVAISGSTAFQFYFEITFGPETPVGKHYACPMNDEHCKQQVFSAVSVFAFLFALLYLTAILLYLLVAVYAERYSRAFTLTKHRHSSLAAHNDTKADLRSLPATARRRTSMFRTQGLSTVKFGLGIGTFAIFYFPILLDRFLAIMVFDNCLPYGHFCHSFYLHSITYALMLLRVVIDPLVSGLSDPRFRRLFCRCCCCCCCCCDRSSVVSRRRGGLGVDDNGVCMETTGGVRSTVATPLQTHRLLSSSECAVGFNSTNSQYKWRRDSYMD